MEQGISEGAEPPFDFVPRDQLAGISERDALSALDGHVNKCETLFCAQIRTGLLLSNSLDTLRDMTSKDWLFMRISPS